MFYFHVLFKIRAVRFETFTIFSRHAHITHGAISHLFADCLTFQLVFLCFSKHERLLKLSKHDFWRLKKCVHIRSTYSLSVLNIESTYVLLHAIKVVYCLETWLATSDLISTFAIDIQHNCREKGLKNHTLKPKKAVIDARHTAHIWRKYLETFLDSSDDFHVI